MLTQKSWLKIINALSELVVFQSYDFEKFLKKLIQAVTEIIPVDSCFVYFYDRSEKKLILSGSKRPHKKLLGRVSLRWGEGITGWVAKHKKIVILQRKAYLDERFKSFDELPEDKFEAFLSVPILDSEGVVGVMNFQHKDKYGFTKDQINGVVAVGKIIASAFYHLVSKKTITKLSLKLEERKVIDKAKWVLMKERGLSEDEAYCVIQKEAMSKRVTMRKIADAILLVYS